MFFLDLPYVSDFLIRTLADARLPVVGTAAARALGLPGDLHMISEDAALALAASPGAPPLYMTSENAIGWLAAHPALAQTRAAIGVFKDKLAFRRLTQPLFPELFFRGVKLADLRRLPLGDIPLPAIIKPSVGFFSMGVHRIDRREQWAETFDAIDAEIARVEGLYPAQVLDAQTFIIEGCIAGDEFAVDAYFDTDGAPVILGIFQHAFASDADVSDRVYMTSKAIVADNLAPFTAFLAQIGACAGVGRFPVHVELRRDAAGRILPIEVNPMRFGGWCTTADCTARAFGINPYLYHARQERPDWEAVLAARDDAIFSIIVLDNSTGHTAAEIATFDYEALLARFEAPLELRKIDVSRYPVFGFLFAKTRADNFAELDAILRSDLREFVILRDLQPA